MKTIPLFLLNLLLLAVMQPGNCQVAQTSGAAKQPAAATGRLQIRFYPVANGSALVPGREYRNSAGEAYSITAFKCYIGAIELVNTVTLQRYIPDAETYFLLDAGDSASLQIDLRAAPFRFNAISFLIGVDSIRNVSGAQAGALDPALGMFWTWNSGYIMAKLEGHSPASSLVNNKFEYHIGGFRGSNSVLQKPVIPFPGGHFVQADADGGNNLAVAINLDAWFRGPNPLSIGKTPACTTPGLLARRISENYAQMFMIKQNGN